VDGANPAPAYLSNPNDALALLPLAIMGGVPLLVVAKNLGHTDTRMVEKHYGHLAPSYIADAIRKTAPQFGFKPDRKVTPLR
jgi:hypothetical protein